jgi:CheY-like chemotaxis protein/glycine cleavage system H lipoate-binding protein
MVFAIVLLTVLVFIGVDLALRFTLKKIEESRVRRKRDEALNVGLRLDFADEAKSLKRVEVEDPKARILAVDDEPVVLDSFRKILVLDGYSIDTVETGQEALALVRTNSYDFVFTDLKMPGMDGVDVTKAVKHLRPDIDVVVITGYATLESAVETMKFGAMDYVQKPFTEDELVEYVQKLVYLRYERQAGKTPLEIRLVTPTTGESKVSHIVNVPGGVYVSPQHTWVSVQMTGETLIGLDDFVHKTLGEPERLDFPNAGSRVERGDPLFTVRRGEYSLTFQTPVSGKVTRVNHELVYRLDLMSIKPYEVGWICAVDPSQLSDDLRELRIGAETVEWYEEEIRKYQRALHATGGSELHDGAEPEETATRIERFWSVFGTTFLNVRSVSLRGAPEAAR